MGILDWIDKPIDQNRMIAAIQRGLRSHANGRPRLLYVEDDSDIVQMVAALLGNEVDLVVAHTLAEARNKLRQEIYDIAILDVALPDGSGLDLIPFLKNVGQPPTPVIIFAAQEVTPSISRHVDGALVKSSTTNEELLEAIKSLISIDGKRGAGGTGPKA